MASIISAGTTSGTSLNLSGDTSGVLQLQTNGVTPALTIDTSQNVGIGTASPAYRLDVSATGFISANISTSFSGAGNIRIADATTTSGSAPYVGSVGNNLTFGRIGTAEYMRITSGGNVGIGTNSPSAILDVSGTIRNSAATGNNARYSIYNDATNWSYISYGADAITRWVTGNNTGGTDTTLLFGTTTSFGGAFSERMRLDNNGRLLTPNQSGFFIGFYQPTSVGGLNYMRVNSPTTFWSVGSGLNLTGGPSGSTRYTAPVTGYYLLQWALMGSGSTGRLIGFVERNGAVVTEANSDSVNYANANTQIVINLSAGDYLDFRTSGSYFTSANGGHNMTIRLLG